MAVTVVVPLAGLLTVQTASAADVTFEAVAGIPGGFQIRGGTAALAPASQPLVDGVGLFTMEYAHRIGRREPLRPLDADLSDWQKAPPCPPDRVLLDRKTGRLRFFAGHDPSTFKSEVTALRREMYGDSALGTWKGNHFFLSHWSVNLNLWAYDVSDPSNPRKVGEVHVPNKTYGLLTLDNGFLIVGTERGTHCVDASNPAQMKVSGPLAPSQWFNPISSRYLAGWKSPAETTHFQ
jgi:hypothetical protein